jgi:glycerate kinase
MAVPLPVADGGEGTFDALSRSLAASALTVEVQNPWGEPVAATFGLALDGTAVVEVAQASGLIAMRNSAHDAVSASTYGTGMVVPVVAVAGSIADDLGAYAQNFTEILIATDAAGMYRAGRSIAGYSTLGSSHDN